MTVRIGIFICCMAVDYRGGITVKKPSCFSSVIMLCFQILDGHKVLILVGEKEQRKMLTSAEMLHEALQNSSMCVLKGYGHGDCSLNHPDEYTNQMNSLL